MALYTDLSLILVALLFGKGRYVTLRDTEQFDLAASSANGYRPVVVMHGVLSSSDTMTDLVQFIQKAHPGTMVLNVDAYNDAVSEREANTFPPAIYIMFSRLVSYRIA